MLLTTGPRNQRGFLAAFKQAASAQQEAASALRDSFKKKVRVLAPLIYSSSRVKAAAKAAEDAKRRLAEEREARNAEKAETTRKMEAATTQYNTQRRALSAQLARAKQENEESTKEFQKLFEDRKQEAIREKAYMEKQLSLARGEVTKLKEQLQKSTEEVDQGRKERASLKRKLSDAERRISELQREIENFRREDSKGSQPDPEVSTRITNAVALNSSSNNSSCKSSRHVCTEVLGVAVLDSLAFGESLLVEGCSSFDATVNQTRTSSKKTTTRTTAAKTTTTTVAASRPTRTTTTRTSTRLAAGARGQARGTTKHPSPEPKVTFAFPCLA
ncbi:gliding-associated protein 45, putative [Perkinsus marinus ATCC 50983]|uniref:Gliding-associated protein 45, putative n=1 Tax=Perkinsus marinus (strain ATCC 50983 / TXsc) TaxID=423536 RepID=C5LV08_PERM5|nr:gliding-associated protein 45, putative [Perkinsus marinus ATCC 50983]EEQ99423.1 gliding-associated protein 45, putative [Perkinsus marinus ATCC 50983]|eukprot:XP_002766706.1 gliding-associated protein 45, putative [Perkinsus marinus ATCC 50983]